MPNRISLFRKSIKLKKSQVYLHCDFEFPDGEKSDKRCIVLNDAKNDQDYIIVPTTKNQYHHLDQLGCQSNCYMLDANQDKCFEIKTWIEFRKIQFKSKEELKQKFKIEKIVIKDCMDKQIFDLIIKCIMKCGKNSNKVIPPKIIKYLKNTQ